MVETRNPTIERAIDIVSAEIELTEDEYRAFRRFLSRLRDIGSSEKQPVAESLPTQAPMLAIADSHQAGGGSHRGNKTQQRVINAYRETIMQLDHFEEEYGNPVHEDIALEFGQQVAYIVFAEPALSPIAVQQLITQAKNSLDERRQYSRELDRELDSLEHYNKDLSEIETRFAECPAPSEIAAETVPTIHDELLGLEQRCKKLVNRRQDMLHSRSSANLRGIDDLSFNRYVYGQRLSVTCPVLHDAVSLFRDIQTQRERCEETLSLSTTRGTN